MNEYYYRAYYKWGLRDKQINRNRMQDVPEAAREAYAAGWYAV